MFHLLALLLTTALAQEPAAPAPAPDPAPAPAPDPATAVPPSGPDPAPADPAPPEVVPDLPASPTEALNPDPWQDVFSTVDRLVGEQAYPEARAVLQWILTSDAAPEIKQRAELRVAALPKQGDWPARLRLVPWQTTLGAVLGGPNMIWIAESRGNYYYRPVPVFAGGLLGGAGGAAASLLYRKDEGITQGQVSAIMLGEELGIAHGLLFSMIPKEGRDLEYGGYGLLLGGLAGAAGGHLLAETSPGDGEMAMAHLGTLWGTGLATANMIAFGQDYFNNEPIHDVLPFYVGGDLGALAGYGLAKAAHLRRVDAQMITLGGAAGGITGFFFCVTTQRAILWSERSVALTTEAFTLGGGYLGYRLAKPLEKKLPGIAMGTLLSGTDDHPILGLPLPSFTPTGDGLYTSVQLVDLRF